MARDKVAVAKWSSELGTWPSLALESVGLPFCWLSASSLQGIQRVAAATRDINSN